MKVVLDATGYTSALVPMVEHRPTPLLRLADKPIIVHVLELLTSEGFRHIDLILSHLPEMIEDLLQEGDRWGVQITYHLARDPARPFSVLGPVARGWEEMNILVGRADVLPRLHLAQIKDMPAPHPILLFDLPNHWSGWGIFKTNHIARIDNDLPFHSLPERFPKHQVIYADHRALTLDNFFNLHHANLRSLEEESFQNSFPSNSRMVEPGVWLSRSVVMHPTARITPPVYIGEGCQIQDNTQIGPQAIIENHCIIDSGSCVEKSVITQQSYIGSGLEISDSIVDQNVLISLGLKTTVKVNDTFILGRLETPSFSLKFINLLERLFALIIGIFLLPLWLPLILWWGTQSIEVTKLPAAQEPEQWNTFLLHRLDTPRNPRLMPIWRYLRQLPSLWNIVRGECHFVGLTPLTPSQVEQLPSDWRKLYLSTKVGLVTLAYVDHGTHPSDTDRFASETFYAAHMNVRFDLHVLVQWFLRRSKRLLGIQS